jgi:hypothetical protein
MYHLNVIVGLMVRHHPKMSDFASVLSTVLTRQSGPAGEYRYVVEAMFVDTKDPGGGQYSILSLHKTLEEADSRALELVKSSTYDFLTFRARPMHMFRPFFDDGKLVLIGNDEKINNAALQHDKRKRELEEKKAKLDKVMCLQKDAETKPGTPANVARLIYLCDQNSSQAKFHDEQAKAAETAYKERFGQLKASIVTNPLVVSEWQSYIKPILEQLGDANIFHRLKAWWSKHIEPSLKLPLPSGVHQK